jgi:hypothetical protein
MASEYGLNFGFRRSDESVRVSEGRFRTPVTGNALLIGTAVKIDPANPGYLVACAANDPLVPGVAGLLVQEENFYGSIYAQDNTLLDSFSWASPRSQPPERHQHRCWHQGLVQEHHRQTRADGRTISAVTVWDATTGTPRSAIPLGWDGTEVGQDDHRQRPVDDDHRHQRPNGYVEGVLLK